MLLVLGTTCPEPLTCSSEQIADSTMKPTPGLKWVYIPSEVRRFFKNLLCSILKAIQNQNSMKTSNTHLLIGKEGYLQHHLKIPKTLKREATRTNLHQLGMCYLS